MNDDHKINSFRFKSRGVLPSDEAESSLKLDKLLDISFLKSRLGNIISSLSTPSDNNKYSKSTRNYEIAADNNNRRRRSMTRKMNAKQDGEWLVCDKESMAPMYAYKPDKDACYPILDLNRHISNDDDRDQTIRGLKRKNSETTVEQLNSSINDLNIVDCLPIEIICKIMCYLDFDDRKSASLVCKRWRNAFFETCFIRHVLFKANNQLFVTARPSSTSQMLTSSSHRSSMDMAMERSGSFNTHLYENVMNLDFENDSADVALLLQHLELKRQHSNDASKHLLPKLRFIQITKCTLSSKTLIKLIDESPCLASLQLSHCDSLFMSGFLGRQPNKDGTFFNLNKLTHLSLSKNRYLTDYLFNMFTASTSSLESLDLSYCCLTKSNYKSLSENNLKLVKDSASMAVLTLENLIRSLSQIGHSLKSINLSGIDLFNHDEKALLDVISKLPNLEELHLARLASIRLETMTKIQSSLPNLKHLDLNCSMQSDDGSTGNVEGLMLASVMCHADKQSQWRIAKLNKGKVQSPQLLLDSLLCMPNLRHLDLSAIMFHCSFGTVNKRNEYIESFATNLSHCSQLEHLYLSYTDFLVNDTFIKIVSKNLTNLKTLDLKSCNQITDVALHAISTNLKSLVSLNISWCQNISDYGLDRSIAYDNKKKLMNELNAHLNGACRCMRKYTEQPFLLIKTKAEINTSVDKSKPICSCLSSTTTTTLLDELSIDENLQQLEKLEILERKTIKSSDLDRFDDDASLRNLRSLRVLRMESCTNITDAGLKNGIDLSQLEELDIKLCTNITGEFIYSSADGEESTSRAKIAKNKYSRLKILNLNQCVKFGEENLIEIVENAPNMRELNVSAITNITNHLISVLLKHKRLLSTIDVSFCSNVSESYIEKYEQFLYNEFGSREFHLDKRFVSK